MSTRRTHLRFAAWAPALALAVYGVFGVFGHSLHGLLPCGDDACQAAAEHVGCCCHHEATSAEAASVADEGPTAKAPGHDPSDCSLCLLLAKIKVGRLAIYQAELAFGQAFHSPASQSQLLPADLILVGAPRAPPVA